MQIWRGEILNGLSSLTVNNVGDSLSSAFGKRLVSDGVDEGKLMQLCRCELWEESDANYGLSISLLHTMLNVIIRTGSVFAFLNRLY